MQLDKLEFIERFLFVLFLLLQEKYQKKQSKGALRANAPPLETPAALPKHRLNLPVGRAARAKPPPSA